MQVGSTEEEQKEANTFEESADEDRLEEETPQTNEDEAGTVCDWSRMATRQQ